MRSTILASIFFSTLVYASIDHCNPNVYNLIYKGILIQALKSDLNKQDFDKRNTAIETLRSLCYGQKSKWEVGREEKFNRKCN